MEDDTQCSQDTISLLLDKWQEDEVLREKVYAVGWAIAQSSRQLDPYEPDQTTWHIGCNKSGMSTRLMWRGNFWWVDDFLFLLYEAERKQDTISRYDDDDEIDGDHYVDLVKEQEAQKARSLMDEHMEGILKWTREDRNCLFLFLILLSLSLDSRAERACFKYNNILCKFRLVAPKSTAILSLRRGLLPILEAYSHGCINVEGLRSAIWMLIMVGSHNLSLDDEETHESVFHCSLHENISDRHRTYALSDIGHAGE